LTFANLNGKDGKMSRKLKFRVWNPTYQEMLYPSSPTKNGDYEEKIYLQLDGQLIGDFKHTGLINCSEHYVIQQFTGMLDNNGKEIYEGDIIKYSRLFEATSDEPTHIKELTSFIRYESAKFGFDLKGFNDMFCDLSDGYNVEVIGNIFENKNTLDS
jgi:uncharacterized phage protein (TIGR01671 family)